MKTARRVNQQHIHASGLCGVDRIEYNTGGIRAFASSHHGNIGPSGPFCQLIACGGTKGIRSGNQHTLSLILQLARKLPYGSSLSHTVDADHQDHGLLLFKFVSRIVHPHLLPDPFDQQLFAFRRLLNMSLLDLPF